MAVAQPSWSTPLLRALVVDFDGTLTDGGPPAETVLADLDRYRRAGNRVVLATGRIFEELLGVWPEAMTRLDAVVCENGAVLVTPDGSQRLAAPVPAELDAALRHRGVELRRGAVLLAGKASDAGEVLDTVQALELDTQLVFNRGELMVLPPGITKGTGATIGLTRLGLSPHNAVGMGDAENDHSLLNVCELAVVPGNAVQALESHADVVLEEQDGRAVSELVRRLLAGDALPRSQRWSIDLGTDADGQGVVVPASGRNLLIVGQSRSGKSYLAGLIAEQLIEAGYATLVIDPEGDHAGLQRLPQVTWLGGDDLPNHPRALVGLLGRPLGNAIVDLSHLSLDARVRWLADLPPVIADERARTGAPHWVVLDEAHLVANDPTRVHQLFDDGCGQLCFVSFLADLLEGAVLDHIDHLILLGKPPDSSNTFLRDVAAVFGTSPAALTQGLLTASPETATLLRHDHPGSLSRCRLPARHTQHVRHWHKYATASLPQHAFHLRASTHHRTGQTAASLAELHDLLRDCDAAVIEHHSTNHDFSRWIRDVIADDVLAEQIGTSERALTAGASVESVRGSILDSIRHRYLTD